MTSHTSHEPRITSHLRGCSYLALASNPVGVMRGCEVADGVCEHMEKPRNKGQNGQHSQKAPRIRQRDLALPDRARRALSATARAARQIPARANDLDHLNYRRERSCA